MAKKVYKFIETRDLVFHTQYNVGKFTNGFLELDRNVIRIFGSHLSGYAWDGCSPKIELFDLYLGTPDGVVRKQVVEVRKYLEEDIITGHRAGDFIQEPELNYLPKTYYASLIHDILYQFKKEVPISRKEADLIFLEVLERANFRLAKIYYLAVRLFGGLYGSWKTK